ncbi:hypothetical protein [Streptomyces sp. SID13726]|uniref:hypothetical protein n=1 Tax=Streptomyces sp. SID13726 TaxID=2706058 RepID=UPI0013BE27EF|nr:hypothetical protein [Streptomyces sp. SID13726]NEA99024.1 hypothetical protein [Streptomyces sp. SID13726]
MKSIMRSRRLIGVLLASATAIMVPLASGTASAVAASGKPAEVMSGKTSVDPSQEQLKELDRVARSHSALGVFGDAHSKPVLMLPAGTPAAERAKVRAEIPAGMQVTVKVSKFTHKKLDQVQKTVLARKWNKDAHTFGIGAAYDGAKDKVVVNLEAPKSAAGSLQRVDADGVEVQPGRFTPDNTRFTDYNPFYGGGAIDGDSLCTAGFAVKDKASGHKYMVTAAHCNYWNKSVHTPTGKPYGNVSRVIQSIDAETIGGQDYTGSIWTGGTHDSSSKEWVSGYTDWMYWGRKLCVSGRTTYNHCGHPVSYSAYGFCYSWFGTDFCVDQTDAFLMDRGGTDECSCNGNFTQPGDSGAPVFETNPNYDSATIAGIHHGAVWGYNGANRMVNIRAWSILRAFNADIIIGAH